jgi:serine/threonine-protein phosphatase PP1 catalytic subunit
VNISKNNYKQMEDTYNIDVDEIIDQLLEVRGCRPGKEVTLQEEQIKGICLQAREIFLDQP